MESLFNCFSIKKLTEPPTSNLQTAPRPLSATYRHTAIVWDRTGKSTAEMLAALGVNPPGSETAEPTYLVSWSGGPSHYMFSTKFRLLTEDFL